MATLSGELKWLRISFKLLREKVLLKPIEKDTYVAIHLETPSH